MDRVTRRTITVGIIIAVPLAIILGLVLTSILVNNANDEEKTRRIKAEQELADIKAHPPVAAEPPPAPASPPPATTTVPDAEPIPSEISSAEAANQAGKNGGFVSTKTEDKLGFWAIYNRHLVLFKRDGDVYRLFRGMADYSRMPGTIVVDEAKIDEMRDALTQP